MIDGKPVPNSARHPDLASIDTFFITPIAPKVHPHVF